MMRNYCLFLYILLITNTLLAQSTEKTTNDLTGWGTFNVEYYRPSGSFWWAETQWQSRSIDADQSLSIAPLSLFQQTVGYEYALTPRWGLGGAVRFTAKNPYSQLGTLVYLAHAGKIRSVEFTKLVGIERIDDQHPFIATRTRVTAQVTFAKNFSVGGTAVIRPLVSYQIALLHDWLLKSNPIYEKRTIDRSRFQLEVAYIPTPKWSVSLFLIDQTDYFFAEEQTLVDKYGIITQLPARNLNISTPVVGLRLHCRFFDKQLDSQKPLRNLTY
jgi:hypothetical protein